MNENNAYTLETSKCEALTIVGCGQNDCDCTMIENTKERRGRTKRMEMTLPREALETLRDWIESVLEFHNQKGLA